MTRWICAAVVAAFYLFSSPAAAAPVSAPTAPAPQSPQITGARVGSLRTTIPAAQRFVVHGTMTVPRQPFGACPYVIVAPDGTPLATQWERVAVLEQEMIVELLAPVVNTGGWSGEQTFQVYQGTSPFDFDRFTPKILRSLFDPGYYKLTLHDQSGRSYTHDLGAQGTALRVHRVGSAAITIERDFATLKGGMQVWMTARAYSNEVEIIVNWHNGLQSAQPDVYFDTVKLEGPAGTRWTPLLPDPVASYPYLVSGGPHVLPERWERAFRVIVHDANVTPDLSLPGWAVGDWSNGGYLVQSLRVPDLSHTNIDLTPEKDDDFHKLRNNLPVYSTAEQPVSELYPAEGVRYGGMTSGYHIEPFAFVPLAYSGQHDGLLSVYVEQLRYAARQMGCIYQPNGLPVNQDLFLNSDGTQPYNIFNNVFIGSQPNNPFGFGRTPQVPGWAPYDPNDWDPIDWQHFIRRSKANKVLVWLANDPLAKRYLMMDAELGRMTWYEGKGGRLWVPSAYGQGLPWGRAEAWTGDLMATAYAVADTAWRQRNRAWFDTFVEGLRKAQMANGLLSAQNFGKMATSPPYGDGQNAYYFVHIANEQVFLVHALRGVGNALGLEVNSIIKRCAEGLWNFAWKQGTDGPLFIYPAGPVSGPRYTYRSQIPAGLTTTMSYDGWHVPVALAAGHRAGANMIPALQAHTYTSSVSQARNKFLSWGLDNTANRADALSLLQELP